MKLHMLLSLPVALMGCSTATTITVDDGMMLGEVWADNWSSMYIDGTMVMEDSVSITTERSFNAERFQFAAQAPFHVAVVMKDFKENDSGLEYIGEGNQQMGDGGYIAQFTDSTQTVIGVSNESWKCFVTHNAPLDKSCENSADPINDCTWETADEPAGWTDPDFDDSAWDAATVHSAADVSPKDGYDEIPWDASAELIWGPDLESNNTVLCRTTIN